MLLSNCTLLLNVSTYFSLDEDTHSSSRLDNRVSLGDITDALSKLLTSSNVSACNTLFIFSCRCSGGLNNFHDIK